MEVHTQVEDIQTLSYQHASGEVFAANNLEAARGMCPVLGKMSLAEAGLLLELEAIGKEQIAEQPNQAREKPVIEKIEKVQSSHNQAVKAAKPVKEATINVAEHLTEESPLEIVEPPVKEEIKPAEFEPYEMAMQQSEVARLASASGREQTEETRVTDMAIDIPVEIKQSPTRDHEVYPRPATEIVEAATSETVNHLISESPAAQSVDMYVPNVPTIVETETPLKDEAIPQAADPVGESLLTEVPENTTTADTAMLAEEEAIEADESETNDDQFETDEAITVLGAFEQRSLENDDNAPEAGLIGKDALLDNAPTERRPRVAPPELPAPVVEIETTMTTLVDTIEQEEAEEPAKTEAILKEIITLPAKLEVAAAEEVEQLEEKLQELFVELFEEADITYSPELIESFVKLTKAHYLEELLATTKDTGEKQNLPAEIGTREFLQKLHYGLSTMKQAAITFDEIGKSIMRLYSSSFEPAVLNFRTT